MSKLVSMYERDDRPELDYPGIPGHETLDCDVAVIGAGGSGLSAAIRAAQCGARVVVVEKMDRLGGNSRLAGGLLSTTSRFQRALGQEDKTDHYLHQAHSLHKYTLDPGIFSRYIRNSGKYLEWLADLGLDMDNVRYVMDSVAMIKDRLEPGPLNNPCYGPGLMGSAVVDLLAGKLEEYGVILRHSTKVTKLLTNDAGSVCGLEAVGQDGTLTVNARSVIIASGGFGGNAEMLRRLLPKYFSSDNYIAHYCWLSTTGDGITLAEAVGAETGKMLSVGMEALSHIPGAYSIQRISRCPIGVIINKNARRFIAEDDADDGEFAVDMQPEGKVYEIFDANMLRMMHAYALEKAQFGDPVPSFEELEADLRRESGEGKVAIAGTLDELAGFIGCTGEALCQFVHDYNELCRDGYDPDFFKDPKYLVPIETGPFYAVVLTRKFDVTMGGVSIGPDLRAVRPDGSSIEGLYAVGDIASGWMGEEYGPLFSSFAWALNSGYLAGEAAAKSE